MASDPPFTVGIEEEYLLVDLETRAVAISPPEELFEVCARKLPHLTAHEFLKSQIEVNTSPCQTIDEARAQLAELRTTIVETARDYGLAPIAASTHPFSNWQDQHTTEGERYLTIAADIQAPVRRLMICGMHVHVGLSERMGENDDLRIDLMNQAAYFLPHLLAFTTSSPFWQGEDTGLKSYRLSVFQEMPRTGLPNQFDAYSEYQRHVDVLVNAKIIQDATKLWWDIRPSARFPTLEMRICDVCPRIDDAAAVAALYQSLLRMLFRLKQSNQRWRTYAPMLINENRWRAQRYGLDEGLLDYGRGALVPCADLLAELLSLVQEDARALGCENNILGLNRIQTDGTSAHRQLACYAQEIEKHGDVQRALCAIVDALIEETANVS